MAGAAAVPIDKDKNVRRAIRIKHYPGHGRRLFRTFIN